MIVGKGSTTKVLSQQDVADICQEAFEKIPVNDKRLLFIIPDHSRTAPMDVMFRTIHRTLSDRVSAMDFLIALGTHPPMREEAILNRVGISKEEYASRYANVRFYNHEWNDPEQLVHIGTIGRDEVSEISNGLMMQETRVTINRMILDYDMLIIVGPTFPHEVVGFSGGNKYFFPGISGEEILNMFHWLGALITNVKIIGTKNTPVRRIVDRAASFIPIEKMCMSLVVKGNDLAGLYVGSPEEAWEEAANFSRQIHIIYKHHPYKRILSCAPVMYDDIWTAGKCMYKLEPVVADGGELIIYAPHISKVSITHGKYIQQIGYHVRDYFVNQMDRFKDVPKGVLAHSTHVKGAGSFINGIEKPRVRVVLATRISKDVCRQINLGYRDPDTIDPDEWRDREDDGILLVPKAGEILYLLKERKTNTSATKTRGHQ